MVPRADDIRSGVKPEEEKENPRMAEKVWCPDFPLNGKRQKDACSLQNEFLIRKQHPERGRVQGISHLLSREVPSTQFSLSK